MPNEPKIIKGIITYVKVLKEGKSTQNGKSTPWTLYQVLIGEGDEEFVTFDAKYVDKLGTDGEWQYQEETRISKGKEYFSKRLVSLPYPGSGKETENEEEEEEVIQTEETSEEVPASPEKRYLKIVKGIRLLMDDFARLEDKLDENNRHLTQLLDKNGIPTIEEKTKREDY